MRGMARATRGKASVARKTARAARGMASVARKTARATRGMASVARKTARATRGKARAGVFTTEGHFWKPQFNAFKNQITLQKRLLFRGFTSFQKCPEYHPQDVCRFSTYSQNQAPSAFRLPTSTFRLSTFDCQLKTANLKIFLALDLSVWFVHFKLNVLIPLSDSP